MHNTEDKQWWVKESLKWEKDFVEKVAPKAGLKVWLNPEKEVNEYAPDLWVDEKGKLADLKRQTTPFFKSEEKWPGYDPTYTVSFNIKDYERYIKEYPDIHVIFYIKWEIIVKKYKGKKYKVDPLTGIWRCTIKDIQRFVEEGAPIHKYKRRKDDEQGNAKDSYILDLRKMKCVWEEDNFK